MFNRAFKHKKRASESLQRISSLCIKALNTFNAFEEITYPSRYKGPIAKIYYFYFPTTFANIFDKVINCSMKQDLNP